MTEQRHDIESKQQGQTVYLVAPIGTCHRLGRTEKIVEVLQRLGCKVVHLAWERIEGDDTPFDGVERVQVLKGGGYLTSGLAKWYLKYTFACRKALLSVPKGSKVYSLGLFGALAVMMTPKSKKLSLFFDHNDNLSKSIPLPAPLKRIVESLEHAAIKRSQIHLVPGEFRWPYPDANKRVLPNVPSRSTLDAALEIAKAKGFVRPEKFTLYVNGWLASTRGIASLWAALQLLEPGMIKVLLAGKIEQEQESLKQVLAHPDVEYLGSLSSNEALATYLQSHATLTFYDPALEINRLAESTKWGDCIATSTAIIVNIEVKTAKPFVDQGGAFAVPYGDARELAELLQSLASDPSLAVQAGERLAANATLPWDEQIGEILDEWLQVSNRA